MPVQEVTINGKLHDLDYEPSLQIGSKPLRTTPAIINGKMVHGVNINGYDYPPADTGCVLYFPGLPGQGTKIWDRSNQGNHGTLTAAGNPAWKRLPSGLWYLDFDGTDDNVNCGDVMGGITTFSIEWWFKVTSTFNSGATVGMVLFSAATVPSLKIYLSSADGKLYFQVYPALTGTYVVKSTTASWTGGVWYHAVGTDDGTNKRIYINKVLENTAAGDHDALASDDLEIGERTGGEDFSGGIALPRIHNVVLTPAQVLSHYQQERHFFDV